MKVQETISRAKELYKKLHKRLLTDGEFLQLLEDYRRAINNTLSAMRNLGIQEKCALCGQSEKGSCCAPEVASWYDPETLLINLLMGHLLQEAPYYRDHCLFLGKKGCTLIARHYYCVHFLCPGIKEELSKESLNNLMQVVGAEILAGSKVFAHLRKINTA